MASKVLAVLLLLGVGIYFLLSAEEGGGVSLIDWLTDPASARADHSASVARDRERTALASVSEPEPLATIDETGPVLSDGSSAGPLELRGDEAELALGGGFEDSELAALLEASSVVLHGRVVAPDGRPWRGVEIRSSQPGMPGQTAASDARGAFELRLRGMGGTLQVDEQRWVRLGGELSLAPGLSVGGAERLLILAPRLELSGRVQGPQGDALEGVQVGVALELADAPAHLSALLPERVELRARSDAQGRWALGRVPDLPGLRARFAAAGHVPYECAANELGADGVVILQPDGR